MPTAVAGGASGAHSGGASGARPGSARSTGAHSSNSGHADRPFRLLPPEPPAGRPRLDPRQREVVAHRGGPLLVLAGPGTGKTTTLVEAVLSRITGPAALTPDQILVLTFSRAAAAELRDRIGARMAARPKSSGSKTGGSKAGGSSRTGASGASANRSGANGAGSATAAPAVTTFHSFCFALVGRYQDPDLFTEPLRLLSGPEQDVVIRELVKGTVAPGQWGAGPVGWPEALRAALTTRGFAEELRAVILRARDLGHDPEDLARFAERAERADWRAASRFMAEYLDVADARGVLDYSELVHRAVLLIETDEIRRAVRDRYRAVFVDEYQDTDPAQVRLLQAVAGDGRDLVVVGDPDQSIYAFRGADLGGILGFHRQFPRRDGRDADIVVLGTSRRAGPRLLAASRKVAVRMPLAGLPTERVREHRALIARPPARKRPAHPLISATSAHAALTQTTSAVATPHPRAPRDVVEALTFPDQTAELAAVADLLRRAHLEDAVPWEQMAVLVRSGEQLAQVRRALLTANVPAEVLGDELPLAQEPAVGALLTALRCAADPAALTPEAARALLTGPLGGLDGADLRRLGRTLRAQELAALADGLPRPAEQLVCEAVADPRVLIGLEPAVGARAYAVARLIEQARADLGDGGEDGSVEDALWTLWSGTPWPERLRRAVERGGPAGRRADQDLDSVIALFAVAQRTRERTGQIGVTDFVIGLQAQAIAADTLAEKAHRGGAVEVLTAHKAKGLQWELVVVAGVQEGLWPDLRRRGSLLDADRIGRVGLTDPLSTAALLAEERRLFYVAITRARTRLVVTAVEGEQEEDESPSRFLRELGVEVKQSTVARRRPLSLPALIAELRRAATDPQAPDALRELALDRLAALAGETAADGSRLVPQADPRTWWGRYDFTDNAAAVADPAAPVPLSASAVSLLDSCGLRWFLEKQAAAQEQSSDKQGFGLVFHALAEEVAKGETAADINVLMDRLDRVWDSLPFDAPWKSEQERRAARRALERFLNWHGNRADGRTVAGAEAGFDTTLTVGGERVRLRGSIDRIEVDDEGGVYLIDFKTGGTPKSGPEVLHDPQLAVYQLVVESESADTEQDRAEQDRSGQAEPEQSTSDQAGPEQAEPEQSRVVQAELVYPRDEGATAEQTEPTVRIQPGLARQEDPDWAPNLVADVARRVLDERFNAYGAEAACRFCSFRKACPKQAEGRELPQ
jgi:superfamily I DNA/RNA helicase/RecB family exonuclease